MIVYYCLRTKSSLSRKEKSKFEIVTTQHATVNGYNSCLPQYFHLKIVSHRKGDSTKDPSKVHVTSKRSFCKNPLTIFELKQDKTRVFSPVRVHQHGHTKNP